VEVQWNKTKQDTNLLSKKQNFGLMKPRMGYKTNPGKSIFCRKYFTMQESGQLNFIKD
jgi:hypothetical protein